MIVKLLVLIALALSLGDARADTHVADEVCLLELEPEPTSEAFEVPYTIARALPSHLGVLAEILVDPPLTLDAGRVFRPPRLLAA